VSKSCEYVEPATLPPPEITENVSVWPAGGVVYLDRSKLNEVPPLVVWLGICETFGFDPLPLEQEERTTASATAARLTI